MHNFILQIFQGLKSLWQFMKIVCMFCVTMLLLYWIQNLTNANWQWLGFITPFLQGLLSVTDSICSLKFDFFGSVVELKYLSALLVLIGVFYLMNILIMLTNIIEVSYIGTHAICKKTREIVLNKSLQNKIEQKEKMIKNYSVTIHTKVKQKFANADHKIDINEQNKLMKEFIFSKLQINPMEFEDGLIYFFDNYNKIDEVLDVLFKVINSSAPIDYAICVQCGNEMKQLKKLVNLKCFGKIIMAADTCYRYGFNTIQKYKTSQMGLFQYENRTLEVHEFKITD